MYGSQSGHTKWLYLKSQYSPTFLPKFQVHRFLAWYNEIHVSTSLRRRTMCLFFIPPSPLSFLSCQAPYLEENGEWMLGDMGHYAQAQYDKF